MPSIRRSLYTHEVEDSKLFEHEAAVGVQQVFGDVINETLNASTAFLDTGTDSEGKPVRIRYVHIGKCRSSRSEPKPRVMMIMGLAASLDAWKPQVADLTMPREGETESPVEILMMDNRGIGESSKPKHKKDYSTTIMAEDALCCMRHLGWDRAHVVGFSMGGMVATKFAARNPNRVLSLAIISSTRGGWDTIPRRWKAWKYILKLGMSNPTPRQRARVDLKFHFSKASLQRLMPDIGRKRGEVMLHEYMGTSGNLDQHSGSPRSRDTNGASGALRETSTNSKHSKGDGGGGGGSGLDVGLKGQVHTCWMHSVSKAEALAITESGFPRLCIHGRQDIIAQLKFGERLAALLAAPLMTLEGAHFIPRERGHEVSLLLEGLILGQPRALQRKSLDPERHMKPNVPERVLQDIFGPSPARSPSPSAPRPQSPRTPPAGSPQALTASARQASLAAGVAASSHHPSIAASSILGGGVDPMYNPNADFEGSPRES